MNDSLAGSNIDVFAKPVKGVSPWAAHNGERSVTFGTPWIRTLPSCMIDIPLQKHIPVYGR